MQRDPFSIFEGWLQEWVSVKEINGFPITPRNSESLVSVWPQYQGKLNPNDAPFLLLAMVFRLDINPGRNAAGEFRFVYGVTDPRNGEPLPFTSIFEYALPLTEKFPTILHWANAIHALRELPYGERFNDVLQTLTDELPAFPLRVRTNDMLLDSEWEMREFEFQSENKLVNVTTSQTPAPIFDEEQKQVLIDWISGHEMEILKGQYQLPKNFLSGAAPVPDESYSWLTTSELTEPLRKQFSLNTCNGCHSGDTLTRFLHVEPRRSGSEPIISDYLNSDLERRAAFVKQLLCREPELKSYSNLTH